MNDRCSGCGSALSARAKFCSECGAPVATSRSGAVQERFAATGERRQLTVLFADLVNSTELAERLDAEDWSQIVGLYQSEMTRVINQHEGHVAQHLGDGLLAYFGYPIALEDDASRAVAAGLAVLSAIDVVNERISGFGITLSQRLGIHTGQVVMNVVGDGANRENLALSSVPHIASRLQGCAAADTLVISEPSLRLVSGQFETRALGVPTLKGISEEIAAYRVMHRTGVRSRLDVAAELSPLVGRAELSARIEARWQQTLAGDGQTVLLCGEAGMGKSRLVRTFRERLRSLEHTWLEGRCSRQSASTAFAPVLDLLPQVFGLTQEMDDEEKWQRLQRLLPSNRAVIIGQFLGLKPSSIELPLAPAEVVRDQAEDTLFSLTMAIAQKQPVVVMLEDLHWCDPSTLRFLQRAIEHTERGAFFIMVTSRPELPPGWPLDMVDCINVERLSEPDALLLVEHLAEGADFEEAELTSIVTRADGVPLHVEELTRMILERPVDARVTDAVPFTLRDSLEARLDSLGEAKQIAQVGAVLGREFPAALLLDVAEGALGWPRPQLEQAILRLQQSSILQSAVAQTGWLSFRHALVQDTAYESLLREKRQSHHLAAANALSSAFAALCSERPEMLAYHFLEGRDLLRAAGEFLVAGKQALRLSANTEAISHLQTGLAAVRDYAEQNESTLGMELELCLAIGPALMATRGYADRELEAIYRRALEICRLGSDRTQLIPVMFGLWTYRCLRALHMEGIELAEEMMTLVKGDNQSDESAIRPLQLEVQLARGANLYYLGRMDQARDALDDLLRNYTKADADHAFIYGQDPAVAARCYRAVCSWHQGLDGEARATSDAAIAAARLIDHPFTLAYALNFAAWLHSLRGDYPRCLEITDELCTLAAEQRIAVYHAFGVVVRGAAQIGLGEVSNGLSELRQGLTAYRSTGTAVILPYFQVLLAGGLRLETRTDDALAALEEAHQQQHESSERWCAVAIQHEFASIRAAEQPSDPAIVEHFAKAVELALAADHLVFGVRAGLAWINYCRTNGADESHATAGLAKLRARLPAKADCSELARLDTLLKTA